MNDQLQKLISDAKNVCVLAPQIHEPESLSAALALFYTLRELGKNVNLIVDNVPQHFTFLIPPADFISQPKNFVISIPRNVADISQVYYEKNEEALKINLTIDKGTIKKDNISFYFSDVKPDLVVTLGIKDFQKELQRNLDSFGFLLNVPIANIDSALSRTDQSTPAENTRFGLVNIIEPTSLTQTTWDIIKNLFGSTSNQRVAQCLLTGLTIFYDNFQNEKTPPEAFELCALLIKQGANRQEILAHLYQEKNHTIREQFPERLSF